MKNCDNEGKFQQNVKELIAFLLNLNWNSVLDELYITRTVQLTTQDIGASIAFGEVRAQRSDQSFESVRSVGVIVCLLNLKL